MWKYTELTRAQKHIVDRMRDGWELGESTSISSGSGNWLQKGGCGRGGETEDGIRYDTLQSLFKKGVILVTKDGFPLRTYKLNTQHEVSHESQ